jgi:tRNA-dihydrouridine synthase 2
MESSKLIVQIGSADPNLALLAALKVSKDVYGIDLNCGCPKRFSLQGGMGAALLENQDLLFTILETLVANLDIPVSCKIRLLYPDGTSSSVERTVKLLKRLEQTKVSAIGVHCRFTDQRPREKAHWDILEQLAGSVKIPIFANGDFYTLDNVHEFEKRVDGKINSFLIARGAQDNVSCFCRDGPLPYRTVMREYLTLAMEYDMPFANAKYALLQMGYDESERVQFKKELTQCKSFNDAW